MRFAEPICNFDARGEQEVLDEFSSQSGSQGALATQGETCGQASDTVLFGKTSHNVDFPLLKKGTVSDVDHNFFPWRGPEPKEKWRIDLKIQTFFFISLSLSTFLMLKTAPKATKPNFFAFTQKSSNY